MVGCFVCVLVGKERVRFDDGILLLMYGSLFRKISNGLLNINMNPHGEKR